MAKPLKYVILLTILAGPVLAYLFLKSFGSNNFDLPYFFPETDDYGEVKIISGDTVFSKLAHFELLDKDADTLSYDYGKISVFNFFFSRCGTICPIANTNLVRTAEAFKNDNRVQFYGITVDPKYDTPEVLKAYSEVLGMDKLNYNLLTGDKRYIYELSKKEFRLPVADASEYDDEITDIDEQFIHSDKVVLIDKKGHFRGFFSGTNKEDIGRLKMEIDILLTHYDE